MVDGSLFRDGSARLGGLLAWIGVMLVTMPSPISAQQAQAIPVPLETAIERRELPSSEALLQAAAQGDAVSVRRLLADGVPATAADAQRGFTALHNAAAMGHQTIVEVLLAAGAQVDAQDRNGVTALISAAYHGHVPVLALLLAHGADVNHRPRAGPMALAAALYTGSAPVLNALLAAGADPMRADAFGVSAHDVAARIGRPDLSAALPASIGGGDD